MSQPFFSVIIPVYNQAKTIQRAIDSVLNQSFGDFEIIVVNDGSTDDTSSVIEPLLVRSNLHYIVQENLGVCMARNNGVALSKGKFLVFLDSDDFLSDNYLSIFHGHLKRNKTLICFGFAWFIDTNSKITKKVVPYNLSNDFGPMLCGAYALSRELFVETGEFDPLLTYSENSDLFFRLRKRLFTNQIGIVLDQGAYIQSENLQSRSKKYSEKKYKSVRYFLKKHEDVFEKSTREFLNFKRIEALCALQNGDSEQARRSMWEAISRAPLEVKSYLQMVLLFVPTLARYYYFKLRM